MDGIVSIKTIGHELALKAAAEAVAKGAGMGCPLVVAVVGARGNLVAFLCSADSPPPSSKIAQDKAYTAASFRVPSPMVYQMVSDNPALREGFATKPGIAMFGGGLPIVIDGEFVGAIGVSGGSEELDIECGNAGLAAIGAKQF
jgi:uncharacterized protein GlcG (DUF336 family)